MSLRLNSVVTSFLAGLDHPQSEAIEQLRRLILSSHEGLSENIKWNGPNYALDGADRITIKIHPVGKVQLIFHRGVRVLEQPAGPLIPDPSGLLTWKTNDRAVATFRNHAEVKAAEPVLINLVREWIAATPTS